MNTPSPPSSRRYLVEHVSEFGYREPARRSLILLRLRPRDDRQQRLLSFDLDIEPAATATGFEDSFGNACQLFNIHREHRHTRVRSRALVEVADPPTPAQDTDAAGWDALARMIDPVRDWFHLQPSRFTRPGPALDGFMWAAGICRTEAPLASLRQLASRLHAAFTYEPGSTAVDSPIERILETGRGVCQDYTHVMLAIARSWGVPSRYISGYLHLEGAPGEQASAAASHSWAEFLIPDAGWVGIDPTNDTLADHRHVRVATGRDYEDAAPTRGVVFGGGASSLKVGVSVIESDAPAPAAMTAAPRHGPSLRDLAPVLHVPVPRSSFDQ